MKFRYHRGSLAESLKTTIEIDNKIALYSLLHKEMSPLGFNFKLDDLECKYLGYDERSGWNTYLISIKNYGVVGMSDAQVQ